MKTLKTGAKPAAFWIAQNSRAFLPQIIGIVLLGAVESLGTVGIAVVSKHMVDSAVASELRKAALAAGIFAGIIAGNLILSIVDSLLSAYTYESMSNALRQRIFHRLTESEWLELSSYHSGDLVTRLTSDISTVASVVVNVLPGIVALGVQILAAFITLMNYEPKLAMLAFLLGPLTVLLSRIWGRRLKRLHVQVQESESRYRAYIQEALQNLLIVKTFCLEAYSRQALQELHQQRMELVLKKNRLNVAASTTIGAGYWTSYILAFSWGAYRLSQHAISFGTLTAFLQLVQQVQIPFVGLARTIPQLIASIGSAARLMEVERLTKEKIKENVKEKTPVRLRVASMRNAAKAMGVVFEGVSFSYPSGEKVLRNVSFELQPGETAALIGSSGEGKTTLIRLLLALMKPGAGSVCLTELTGRRVQVSPADREFITYVPQGNTLFSGTIAENLRRGRTDATDSEIEQALIAGCAWEFVAQLPQGIQTMIGEGGLGLSEGQAQRLAIARALLKRSPVMILDEATSSLDMQTELKVLQAIKGLRYPCTCLIITHRSSALRICSRILKLEDGLLTEIAGERGGGHTVSQIGGFNDV